MNEFMFDIALQHEPLHGFIFGGTGMAEMMVIGLIAVMLFGKNLPGVARKFGKTYREFRKGLSEFQSQVRVDDYVDDVYNDDSSNSNSSASGADDWSAEDFDDYSPSSAPMFEPPPSEPKVSDSSEEAD